MKIFSKNLQIIIFNPFLTRVERCRARANTSFRFEGARITLLQFCAGLQSACTIAENSESVRKSNLTAKISFVLAYRALVPLYKTQNQIHPAPQAKILRICTSKCKILPPPQAIFFADLHFSNAKSYRESAY